MKYAFVSISIMIIWIAIILMIIALNQDGILLPIVGIVMTVILFMIGFGEKK